MDNLKAFAIGEANRGKEMKVFDWNKTAQLIKERKPKIASAGLSQDWEYTGGEIFRNGKPVDEDDTYTYLASTWAIPELDLDGEIVDCFIMESETEWDAKTYWPKSALRILEDEE